MGGAEELRHGWRCEELLGWFGRVWRGVDRAGARDGGSGRCGGGSDGGGSCSSGLGGRCGACWLSTARRAGGIRDFYPVPPATARPPSPSSRLSHYVMCGAPVRPGLRVCCLPSVTTAKPRLHTARTQSTTLSIRRITNFHPAYPQNEHEEQSPIERLNRLSLEFIHQTVRFPDPPIRIATY